MLSDRYRATSTIFKRASLSPPSHPSRFRGVIRRELLFERKFRSLITSGLLYGFPYRSTTLRSMRSFLKLGKQRPPRARSCDSNSETKELLDRRDSSCPTSNEPSRTNSMTSLETNASDNDSQLSASHDQEEGTALKPAKRPKPKVNISLRQSTTYIVASRERRSFLLAGRQYGKRLERRIKV